MPTAFHLHDRLAADTVKLADLPLSKALVMKDHRFPWIILVPRRSDCVEMLDLPGEERQQLWSEIDQMSSLLKDVTQCDKLNVAALGNMVPQLHVHVIARFKGDAAWPGPVWCHPLEDEADLDTINQLKSRLHRALYP